MKPGSDKTHAECVASLVQHGGYASLERARLYVEKMGSLWRPVLGLDDECIGLDKQLELTPTMTLLLHLFGRAVHHHIPDRARLPVISAWREMVDTDGCRRRPFAVSKPDIARIIRKSSSAVDDAVSRLRGKKPAYERLYEKRVAYALYVPTGIMLDMMTNPNLSFSFMLDDYSMASRVAEDARLNDAETNHKQRMWCREAAEEKCPTGAPHAAFEHAPAISSETH